jgi:hypothetical protein
MINNTSSNEAH